jgi:hypothetical protein
MLEQASRRLSGFRFLVFLLWMVLTAGAPAVAAQRPTSLPQDVLTYHADNLRTGWFSAETRLTTSNVNPQSFGLLQTVIVDGRVDGEPLIALQQDIQGKGTHDVVYVATENNTVYALDAGDGSLLWKRHVGTPVPYQYKSFDDNVFPVMGILSTPVLDRQAGALYFVADIYNGTTDSFRLFAVSLSSGLNLVKPVTIHFSQALSDGKLWKFKPRYQLQRPGLLKANGNIYVAFGSNGDINPDISRGTIVGYDAATLTQLGGQLTDKLRRKQSPYFLSSIWQSGYGLASDANGDVYFSTGNSDPNLPSYSKSFNRPDSVVHLSGDLSTLLDSFTPADYFQLDQADADLASGAVMLLPDQPGSIPHLAIAGGKDGHAFLLNRDDLGGYTKGGPDRVLQTVTMGNCWCGPASFTGADGATHVLTGGRNGITSWKLETSPSVRLAKETSTGPEAVSGLPDDGGSIPVVSSNGTTPGTGIVWFVQKPATSSDEDPGTPVTLMAYAASNLTQQLVSIQAGTWTHAINSNANLIPSVANGRVYVPSNKQLQIFGLLSQPGVKRAAVPDALKPSKPDVVQCTPSVDPLVAVRGVSAPVHEFTGKVCRLTGTELQLVLRNGRSLAVDISGALNQRRPVRLTPGRTVRVRATIDAKGAAHAQKISPSHVISPLTPADR